MLQATNFKQCFNPLTQDSIFTKITSFHHYLLVKGVLTFINNNINNNNFFEKMQNEDALGE